MRWPWSRPEPQPLTEEQLRSTRDAERHLMELLCRQGRVDELERRLDRELLENNFTRRMRRGLEGR